MWRLQPQLYRWDRSRVSINCILQRYPSMPRTLDTKSTMTRSWFWAESLGGSAAVLKSQYFIFNPSDFTWDRTASPEYKTLFSTLKQQVHPTLSFQSDVTSSSLPISAIKSTGRLMTDYTEIILLWRISVQAIHSIQNWRLKHGTIYIKCSSGYIPIILYRHNGHVLLAISQGSTHVLWNSCRHGNIRSSWNTQKTRIYINIHINLSYKYC